VDSSAALRWAALLSLLLVQLLRCGGKCVSAVLYVPVRNLLQQFLKERLHPGARLLVDCCDDLRSVSGEVAYESGDLLLIGTLTKRKECCGGWSGAAHCDPSK
jgi:hypothetical protein